MHRGIQVQIFFCFSKLSNSGEYSLIFFSLQYLYEFFSENWVDLILDPNI